VGPFGKKSALTTSETGHLGRGSGKRKKQREVKPLSNRLDYMTTTKRENKGPVNDQSEGAPREKKPEKSLKFMNCLSQIQGFTASRGGERGGLKRAVAAHVSRTR